ncbi:MAG: hypothetical protein K6A36_00560 [Paludibacteraceae bacterium]|nr:hypothetical protein [Paludibacteraceae bacterium]
MIIELVLGLVMTWTVESKYSAVPSGDVSENVIAEYYNTEGKGTVRAGDTATLTLRGLNGIQLQKVEYTLRSNQKSGSGNMIVMADERTLAEKKGTLKDWCGAYDNTDYHAVTAWSGQCTIKSALQLRLIGTENSLYIDQFIITYQPAPAYKVTLMIGNEPHTTLTEKAGGAGVELPAADDKENWKFMGWAPQDSWQVNQLPDEWYRAGTHYYPSDNTTLWGLWQYAENTEPEYVTELETGDYLYLSRANNQTMSGTPQNKRMESAETDLEDENQVYHITFNEAKDSATIQHKVSGKYIGYSETKTPALTEKASTWQVWHGGDSTIFYITVGSKYYILWPSCLDDNSLTNYTGIMLVYNVTNTPTVLLSAEHDKTDSVYTGHPECGLGTDFVLTNNEHVVVPFGIYELHIWKGKKYLRLRR